MRSIKYFLPVILACCLFVSCGNDIETLRKRFTDDLLNGRINNEQVKTLIESINPDGTWPGIDYVDTSRTGFQHSEHLSNMVAMTRAFKKEDSPLKGDQDLKKAYDLALNFWLKNDFTCENWWNNQIGTPDEMVSMLLMMDNDLSQEQVQKMIAITERANLNASGARPSGDRIKIAGIYAKCALFKRDEKTAEEVMKVIEGEIKFAPEEKQKYDAEGKPVGEYIRFPGTGRGIQYDYSFHHRSDRVNNTLSYGTGYADAFAEWAAMVADTRYRFSDSSMHLLTDYYLEGICKQLINGRTPDPGILNRDISRKGSGRAFGNGTPERLLKASDYRKDELMNVIRARNGEPSDTASFARFFWQTEHFVFQRPKYYASVRMYSTRNRNMEEPYNGEGLKNHYRADGTNYLSVTGTEYKDIAPVFDWRKIPGATIMENDSMPPENEIQKTGLTDFVGAVTDGMYGAAAFDFISPHDGTKARKSWFFFDDEYFCLGTGISSDNKTHSIATTLNQCWLNGPVTVNTTGGSVVIPAGLKSISSVNWIFHNGTGYLFPAPERVNLFNQAAKGTWFSVNRQTSSSKEMIIGDVFKLWIDHGKKPVNAGYRYIVFPNSKISDLESYQKDPWIKVLSNSSDLQAVYNNKQQLAYAVFYNGGQINIPGDLLIRTDSPCILMLALNESGIKSISVSDPSRKLKQVTLTINSPIEKTGPGFTFSKGDDPGTTKISIDLPQGHYAGKSVTIGL